jgi:hypothetical protein
MLLEPQVSVTAPPGPTRQFGANLKERFFGFAVLDATTLLWELRQVKRTIDDIERFLSGKK